jgi:hypothetical protein
VAVTAAEPGAFLHQFGGQAVQVVEYAPFQARGYPAALSQPTAVAVSAALSAPGGLGGESPTATSASLQLQYSAANPYELQYAQPGAGGSYSVMLQSQPGGGAASYAAPLIAFADYATSGDELAHTQQTLLYPITIGLHARAPPPHPPSVHAPRRMPAVASSAHQAGPFTAPGAQQAPSSQSFRGPSPRLYLPLISAVNVRSAAWRDLRFFLLVFPRPVLSICWWHVSCTPAAAPPLLFSLLSPALFLSVSPSRRCCRWCVRSHFQVDFFGLFLVCFLSRLKRWSARRQPLGPPPRLHDYWRVSRAIVSPSLHLDHYRSSEPGQERIRRLCRVVLRFCGLPIFSIVVY